VPCYNYFYLSDFEGRLSLKNAKINIQSKTAFADTKVESFVDAGSNVWIIDCDVEYKEIMPGGAKAEISLERWGSRTFSSWYNDVNEKSEEGLGNTKARMVGNDLVIEEKFDGGLQFSVACRVLQTPVKAELISSHTLTLRTEMLQKQHFQIMVAVVTSKESQGLILEAVFCSSG
jgi:alpha-L-fucosidase 2